MSSNKWNRPRNRKPAVGTVRPAVEALEDRCVPDATPYRPIDEAGNNPTDPTLGTVNTPLLRVSPEAYRTRPTTSTGSSRPR